MTLVLVSLVALAGPVHAMTLSPLATAGGWRIMTGSDPATGPACAAYRAAPQPDVSSILLLRLRQHGVLRVATPAGALAPGTQIKVEISAGTRVKGVTAGRFISPTELDVDLGDLVTTLRRIDAPIELRLPDRSLTLQPEGIPEMREALAACVAERIGEQFAGPAPEPPVAPQDRDVTEERSFLDIRIGAQSYRLETLLVKPATAQGRLPVALIAHGQGAAETMPTFVADHLLPEARDLAHRGYLVAVVIRRGFGRSDGIPGVPGAVGASCEEFARVLFDAAADELGAALTALGERNDADVSRAIVIGQSAGGPAGLVLASRGRVRAAINVSGGLRCNRPDSHGALSAVLAAIGADNAVPTLWLYAPHDSFFHEQAARAMHAAYTATGGRATLVMTPAIKGDGHDLFTDWDGRNHWLAALDQFLSANSLSPSPADAVMRQAVIPEKHRAEVLAYLSSITPKVLLVDRATRRPFAGAMPFGLRNAYAFARMECERAGADCVPVMENFRLLDGEAGKERAASYP
jgi:dienelactone hydrolase